MSGMSMPLPRIWFQPVRMTTAQDWEDPAKALQYGPGLPACPGIVHCIDVVQAAGGHSAPGVYAGDPGVGPNDGRIHALTVWKWAPGMANWLQIVPSPTGTPPSKSAIIATRFFVDPYNSRTSSIRLRSSVPTTEELRGTWTLASTQLRLKTTGSQIPEISR